MPGHHSGRRFLEQELSETLTFASFVWIHMFLSAGQGLLSAVSWCSVRSSISEDVSLMNQWREKYPTSTDSSVSCHLPNSLVISVQVNDFFFFSLHSCADITTIQLQNISSIPLKALLTVLFLAFFSSQPFKFLSKSCSVEFLVDSKRGKYGKKLGESMAVQYLI